MESPQETSLPQEVDISTLSISTPAEQQPEETISTTPNTEQAESPAPTEAAPAVASYEPLSYDELFPALPGGIPGSGSASGDAPASNWSTKTQDSMRITSSVITQVFHIPNEERARIDGTNQFGDSASSRICADITARTGAHIEISSAKDGSLTFLVTGKNDAVLKARRDVLIKYQTQARQVINIPKDHHRFILGKKGKKLQDLEAATSTKIQVPNVADDSDEVSVVGTKENIEKAMHEIRLVSDEQSKQAFERLEIPKQFHPFICGPNNEKINALMAESAIRINVPPISVMKNEMTISGEVEGVGRAKEAIMACYKEMERKCQTVSVEVRKSQHRYVIGPRGANIAEILAATGVSVEMPTTDSPSETITLRGPQDKLGGALTMVYAKANSVVQANVEAPTWLHKFIIGRKGANIKQITQDLPKVHVEFTDNAGGIKLEGPPEEVETAREKLSAMIEEMQSKLSFDQLTVDPKFYKHIIGKSGSNINRIRNETGVLINISEADGTNIIRLEGSPEGVQQAKKELSELVAKMENEKERDIIIEQRFHRNIIGTKGDKIREIRDKFNQVQISFPDPGEQSEIVKIRGPKDDVDQCYRHLQKMVKEMLESSFQVKVSVFRQFHKFVIGKAGANINKIREETSTRIDLPSEGSNSDEITITGKQENCEIAKRRIEKIQDDLAAIVEMDIIIPAKFHNSMIGAGGKLIQSISEECGGVAIKFPPHEAKSDKVTIRGPKDDVAKAKTMLVELSNEKQEASFTAEVRARPQHHRFLIGRSGANIKKIRDATGARIIFPTNNDTDKELITIIGKKESIGKAKEQLESIIKELDKISEDTMTVDPKYHRHFVARRGEILRQISEQYGGVTVSFPRSGVDSDKVTLKGVEKCVAEAKARILEIVNDLEQMVSIEVIIPQRYHRTVMGARGSKVQNVTTEFDVQIKFPDKNMGTPEYAEANGDAEGVNGDAENVTPPQDIVRVSGKKENCDAARDALLALVPVTLEVTVPFRHHRYIIGQKGESVRSMMTAHDVNIQVPPADEQSDIIRITGPPANTENARVGLEEKVKQLEEDEVDRQARSHQVKVEVDPEYHPKIIGKRGAVISKIREKYDVNIQFPPRGSTDEHIITIQGYEKNAEEAKAAILAITGEFDKMVKEPVEISSQIHSRLIGGRGRAIRAVMEEFKVEIKFPRGDDDPNIVVIMGSQEAVDDCRDHLLNLAEEYMQDIDERTQYRSPDFNQDREGDDEPGQGGRGGGGRGRGGGGGGRHQNASPHDSNNVPGKPGFVIQGAPWSQEAPDFASSEDFPTMGAAAHTPSTPMSMAWGPRR